MTTRGDAIPVLLVDGTNTVYSAAPVVAEASTRISTSTTTLVKTGAGRLHRITIGALGTVASSVTVYDALTATGTAIAVINSLTLYGTFTYELPFTTGLTVVTTGTVAPDVVVVWS